MYYLFPFLAQQSRTQSSLTLDLYDLLDELSALEVIADFKISRTVGLLRMISGTELSHGNPWLLLGLTAWFLPHEARASLKDASIVEIGTVTPHYPAMRGLGSRWNSVLGRDALDG